MKNLFAQYLVNAFFTMWRERVAKTKQHPLDPLERMAIELFAEWAAERLKVEQPLFIEAEGKTLEGWYEDAEQNTYHFESPVPLIASHRSSGGNYREFLVVIKANNKSESDQFLWVYRTKPIDVG